MFNFFSKSKNRSLQIDAVLLFDNRYLVTSGERPIRSGDLVDIELPDGIENPSPGTQVRFQIQKDTLSKTVPVQAIAIKMEIISENPKSLYLNINNGVKILDLMKDNAYLIDVRGGDEYASGHIPGALLLPVAQIDQIADIVTDKTGVIMLYCGSGSRSAAAASQLRKMGYRIVIQLDGLISYRGKLIR